jgi:hypothetical protein
LRSPPSFGHQWAILKSVLCPEEISHGQATVRFLAHQLWGLTLQATKLAPKDSRAVTYKRISSGVT